jgi:RNA polymerase sigma-70 factor (ECF subfamily)
MGTASSDSPHVGKAQFASTRWSLVRAAGRRTSPEADRALASLCEAYWYPLYAHARSRGLSVEEASDRTQGFFARLLEKDDLADADPDRGRFRAFLLTAFRHFLANEWDRERAQRRGGGRPNLSLDFTSGETRFRTEPSHEMTAERNYDRQWALTLLERALGRLREEYQCAGKLGVFDALKPALAGERSSPYAELATRLGMTEGAVKTAVHRLRSRCGEILRDEIAQTVTSADEIDDELKLLFAALSS